MNTQYRYADQLAGQLTGEALATQLAHAHDILAGMVNLDALYVADFREMEAKAKIPRTPMPLRIVEATNLVPGTSVYVYERPPEPGCLFGWFLPSPVAPTTPTVPSTVGPSVAGNTINFTVHRTVTQARPTEMNVMVAKAATPKPASGTPAYPPPEAPRRKTEPPGD